MHEIRGVREVRPGRWEATISSRLLPGGRVFRTFDDEAQARAYKLLMQCQLVKGVVPPELLAQGRRTNPLPRVARKAPPGPPAAVVRGSSITTPLVTVTLVGR